MQAVEGLDILATSQELISGIIETLAVDSLLQIEAVVAAPSYAMGYTMHRDLLAQQCNS